MKSIRLRYLAEVNPPTQEFDSAPPDAEVTFMPLETVWADGHHDSTRRRPKAEVTTGYTRFRRGDVLCPKVAPTFQAGRVALLRELETRVGAGTTELHVLRPRPMVDARYVMYALRSKHFLDEGVSAFQGVAGLQRVPADFVADFAVADLGLDEQRRIGNFLDAETARIDRLIDLRERQVRLIEQRPWIWLLGVLAEPSLPWVPLRRAIAFLADGPFGSAFTSADYSPAGAAVVRLGNIGFGEYRPSDQAYVPEAIWASFPRCHVRAGDLLIAGLGDPNNHAGRACVAPDLGPALVKGKCFCARTVRSVATEDYLALLLSSPLGREVIAASAQGSTRAMINLEIVKAAVLPMPDVEQQGRIVDGFHERVGTSRALALAGRRQIDLMRERREAIITAAVSGQLDVATAPGVA